MDDIEKHSREHLEGAFEAAFTEVAEQSSETTQKKPSNTPFFGSNSNLNFKDSSQTKTSSSEVETFKPDGDLERSKSSLRMKYEAEVEVIKKTQGDLEKIRRTLGLSKRKMAQLLLVDPSAWTRWTSKNGEAPPHIYRALQWYLILQDKHPELKSSVWLNSVARPQMSEHEIENIKKVVLQKAQDELNERKGRALLQVDDLKYDLKKQLQESEVKLQRLNKRFVFLIALQAALIASLIAFISSS